MRNYCTYFDENYLPRGLALYRSMVRHDSQAVLWVLCLTQRCHDILTKLNLPGVKPFTLQELEARDPELAATRGNRKLVEYYFTCTAPLMLYVLRGVAPGELVTYLDSDMYFFDEPSSVYSEIGDHSVAIVPHRFPPQLRALEDRGIYNVGWVSIRNDVDGMACAEWWRARCIEWCRDIVEPERFADQKYLNRWPQLFKNVVVLKHKGVNAAPYNLSNFVVHKRDERTYVDDDPLVIFHFHGFRQLSRIRFDPNLADYNAVATSTVRRDVYGAYIKALENARNEVASFFPKGMLYARYPNHPIRGAQPKLDPLRTAVNEWRLLCRYIRQVLDGKQIFYIGGRVL